MIRSSLVSSKPSAKTRDSFIQYFSEKNIASAEKNLRSMKTQICRLNKFFFAEQMDAFIKTKNSRVNRAKTVAPKKFTSKGVYGLVS